ncbi:uncharacterized protein LOC113275613 [Papaver somniferum]|uniref:uncharacterized protein LOC113275613 n=1 Tax=Papaver somniferum TaxID=3469 RepID=UPI000E705AFB|nr:uncharacterized protein LOC113275613 [Papaver somniferum]
MSTTTTTREDYDQTSHQEMMFDRLVKSQEDMFSRLETLLSNVLASQQQTLEILICNNTAKDQDDSSAENQQEEEDVPDSNSDNDDDYLIFEDEEITEVPADDEEEDQRKSGNYGGQIMRFCLPIIYWEKRNMIIGKMLQNI